jgi:osomolarity two-component system sensor histidine kinase TcsA
MLIHPFHQFSQHVGFVKVTRNVPEHKEAEAHIFAAFEESLR